MRACKCPNCGANLSVIDDDREFMFCEYCGVRVDLVDQRTVHTEHFVDDAEVKRAEAKIKSAEAKVKKAEAFSNIADAFASPFRAAQDRRLAEESRERQLKQEARIQKDKARVARSHFWLSLIRYAGKAFRYMGKHPKETLIAFAVLIIISSGVSFIGDAHTERTAASIAARIESGEAQYPDSHISSEDYRDYLKVLRDAGFTNISLVPVHDLRPTEYYKENRLIEITVDGAPTPKKGAWYSNDVPIVIKYHLLKEGAVANSSTLDAFGDALSDTQKIIEETLDSFQDTATKK